MSPNEPEYRVVYSEAIRSALNTYVDVLLLAGWEKQAVRALVTSMDNNLKRNPTYFGNPLYSLKTSKIIINVGFVRPLAAQFGIHEKSKSVFVRKLILMTTKKSP